MNLNAKLVSDLQRLFNLEPALIQELKQAGNQDQIIECVIAAASRHGMALDADELAALLLAFSTNMAKGEINDEQLAGVAGGNLKGIVEIFIDSFERIKLPHLKVEKRY